MKLAVWLWLFVILLGIAFLGGIYNQKFTRYTPSAPESGASDSDFKLAIHPEFTSGRTSGTGAVIPLLWYIQREPAFDPHVILNLTPSNPAQGFAGKKSVTLTSLKVNNEKGETFDLIKPPSTKDFPINNSGYGNTRWDFGPIQGDQLTILAEGFVLTDAEERRKFTCQRSWKVTRSSRFGFGSVLSE